MNSKDQQMLEEAYQKVMESEYKGENYLEDALRDPKKYELNLYTNETEDWDGNTVYDTVAYLYHAGSSGTYYERIDNPSDIENLEAAFEKHNLEGISDNRRKH